MTFRGLTEVVKICSSRAVFAKMTTLSSNACVLYAQPRVSHLKAPGNRRCPQRRGVFTLTVRGIFAESGGFESSPTYQVRLKRPYSCQRIGFRSALMTASMWSHAYMASNMVKHVTSSVWLQELQNNDLSSTTYTRSGGQRYDRT